MKVNYCMMMLIAVAIVSGCSKDEDPSADRFRLKKVVSPDGTSTTYTYNDDGNVTEVRHTDATTKYKYNSKGMLITQSSERPNFQFYESNYSYREDGTAQESILRYKYVGEDETRQRTTYKYSDGRMVEYGYSFWDFTTETWTTPTVTTLINNEEGWVTRASNTSSYYEYTYDAKGNLITNRQYEKTADYSRFYLFRESKMTYDDKKNIYATANIPYPRSMPTGENNLLDQVTHTFDEKGVIVNTNNYSTTYEYNEAGYPIRRSGEEYTLEKY